jgi:hypothetical protein
MYLFKQGNCLQFELRHDAKEILHNELEGKRKVAAVAHFESLSLICLRRAQEKPKPKLGQSVPSPNFKPVTS